MSTPRNNLRGCIPINRQLEAADFLKNYIPDCWGDCPKKFYDDLRDSVGNLTENNTVPVLMDGVDYALGLNPCSWREATRMRFTIMFGAYRGKVEFTKMPIEAPYCGLHRCHQCLDFYDSGGKPKWRCVLCQHFPTYGKTLRICNGGPNSPTWWERDIWANSFPCKHYERRTRSPAPGHVPAPLTDEERRADDWIKARFHAGVTLTKYLEASNNKPERSHVITVLSARLQNIEQGVISGAVDDAFEDILKIRERNGSMGVEGVVVKT